MGMNFLNYINDDGRNEYDEVDEETPSRDIRSILIWLIILFIDCGVGVKAIIAVWICLYSSILCGLLHFDLCQIMM